jgi:hypothetical protein
VSTEVVETCDEHGCELTYYDDGGPESGPQEPYLDCPQCREERKPKCPECGAGDPLFKVTSRWTPNYGGGYDTYEKCDHCGYSEVYV